MEIVKQVTDDKSLPKAERKRLQIEHAPHISYEAKCVKLADKVYNLRDLCHQVPEDWTSERAQEYFLWAKKVTDGMKGTNTYLDAILNELYASKGLI